ncbi:MAG: hypothetical protein C0518_03015 [Opitutus sp.]|nr:hypothetical protein [Opitutus sp.]
MSTPAPEPASTLTPAASPPASAPGAPGAAATRTVSPSPATSGSSNSSFRSLVVPREHGSWALALEPVALGLLVAPSLAGGWLALAVAAGFLTRRPLKLAVTLPARDPRRVAAFRWTLLFSFLALSALALAAVSPAPGASLSEVRNPLPSLSALWPLLLAVPFGGAFLWFDLRNEMREAQAELAGSIAFALVPAAFATLAGWTAAPALALAMLMLARSVPTVLAVRTFLRLAKGRDASGAPAVAIAIVALAVIVGLAWRTLVPPAAVVVAAVLVLRTALLLSPFFPAWSARRVGMMEAVIGVLFLGALAAAYAFR